ncbi:MAG TPA: glutamate formimidoyltransferase [Acidobacteriota bacterium]|nr:glutamate formimidoyltransferase [Acidobacteriota bacterium]
MNQVVECVMNVSEGRRPEVIAKIAEAIARVPESYLLHQTSDFDHNRSVFTFAGRPSAVEQAAWKAILSAVSVIDIQQHLGVHPRVGAVDVVPFVPLRGIEIEDCVQIARRLGKRVGEELEIPVYLYEKAAFPGRKSNLAEIRRGQIEGLRKRMVLDPESRPDYGPAQLHPTAGATVIGARDFLIAFNVYLRSSDVTLAKEIARRIRERDGGLAGVKALGLFIERRNQAQVSINITNPRLASLAQVFDRVQSEACRLGTQPAGSEIIGLIPRFAVPADVDRLLLEDAIENHILESILERAMAASQPGADAL